MSRRVDSSTEPSAIRKAHGDGFKPLNDMGMKGSTVSLSSHPEQLFFQRVKEVARKIQFLEQADLPANLASRIHAGDTEALISTNRLKRLKNTVMNKYIYGEDLLM